MRRLRPDEADRHYPVHLTGVLTFFDQSQFYRIIQDETAGIYFYLPDALVTPELRSGQRIELWGETSRGEYAPIVNCQRLKVLGPGEFPRAKPVTFDQLASGQQDCQFIDVQGIVRSAYYDDRIKYFLVDVATGGGRFTALASTLPVAKPQELADSSVRVHGVCVTRFNRQRQLFDLRLLVPRSGDLVIETPAPPDPFSMPAQPIGNLLRFTPEGPYGHRAKVSGVVCYGTEGQSKPLDGFFSNLFYLYYPSAFRVYIQDGTEGLYVETRQTEALGPGDKVEVVGFPARGEYTPMLQDAVFRKVGTGRAPAAVQVTADEALKGTYDCRLIRIEATLLERARRGTEQSLALEAGGFVFHAYLEGQASQTALENIRNGSRMAVTGICLIDTGNEWHVGEDWRAKSFRVLMRSPADATVLASPPWWTLQKLLWAITVLFGVVLAAFAWVVVLRKRVNDQTQIIGQRMQAEADLKDEILEASNREQRRIAHDLHDGVCQQLAAIAYLTDVLADQLQAGARPESTEAEKIGGLIHEAMAETRTVARGLFPGQLEEGGLVSALEELAANTESLYKNECRYVGPESLPPLASNGARHLFYIAQEAVRNATRHGAAAHVTICLESNGSQVTLSIEDDGTGFEGPPAASGMGIRIMQYRARVIGATLNLKSRPGQGTQVSCSFNAATVNAANHSHDGRPKSTVTAAA